MGHLLLEFDFRRKHMCLFMRICMYLCGWWIWVIEFSAVFPLRPIVRILHPTTDSCIREFLKVLSNEWAVTSLQRQSLQFHQMISWCHRWSDIRAMKRKEELTRLLKRLSVRTNTNMPLPHNVRLESGAQQIFLQLFSLFFGWSFWPPKSLTSVLHWIVCQLLILNLFFVLLSFLLTWTVRLATCRL